MRPVLLILLANIFLISTWGHLSKRHTIDEKTGEIIRCTTTDYGCPHRPTYGDCIPVADPHCQAAQIIPDLCWNNVYYECDQTQLVPKVCTAPLVVKSSTQVCVWETRKKRFIQSIKDLTCGCFFTCNYPPAICPKIEGDDCKGTVLFLHKCDCQFFWRCPQEGGTAQLAVCNNGYYFKQTQTTPYSTGQCVLLPTNSPVDICFNE